MNRPGLLNQIFLFMLALLCMTCLIAGVSALPDGLTGEHENLTLDAVGYNDTVQMNMQDQNITTQTISVHETSVDVVSVSPGTPEIPLFLNDPDPRTSLAETASTTESEPYVFVTTWGTQGYKTGQLDNPIGVTVDSSGNVYVADNYNNRIQKFSSIGTFLAKWGSYGTGDGQFKYPQGIAADLSGNVYVTDTSSYRIQKFNSTGTFLAKWGSRGSNDGQFESPSGIAVDSSGNIYVADTNNNRIQKFSSTGTFLGKWGSIGTGDGQFQQPKGVAVDSSGYVYVSDANRIQKFTTTGTFLAKWGSYGSADGQFNQPLGLAVDSSGNVFVADDYNYRIQKFNSTGSFLTKWGSYGSGDGKFNQPEGVTVDSSGYVYVTDTGNNRIQKFMRASSLSANFTASPTSGNAPLAVQFTDTSTGSPTSWSWDFGDGSTSTARSPTHTYTKAGTFIVGLTVTNADGSNQIVQRDYITVVVLTPVANFRGTPASGTDPLNVTFTDLSTNTPTKWEWNFGDGSFSTLQNPTHTYNYIGCYGVSLNATNEGGSNIRYFGNYITVSAIETYEYVRSWGGENDKNGSFENLQGITVDVSGNVYTSEYHVWTNRIQKFTSNGTFLNAWGAGAPEDVSTDSHGNVYVADTGNCRIQKFTSNGTFITKWGEVIIDNETVSGCYVIGSGDGELAYPMGVAVDLSDNVYVSDSGNSRIQKFTSSGSFITKWGSEGSGDGQFLYQSAKGITVDSSGNVSVADYYNNRTQKFSSTGTFLGTLGSYGYGKGQFKNPTDVAVDASGNIYVADFLNNRIQKFTSTGSFITRWGVSGYEAGRFNHPYSVAIDLSGNVYVADMGNSRIQKFALQSPPVANFTANITSGVVPLAVKFNDSSTGSPASRWWSFGDNDTWGNTVSNPVHIYTLPGTYNVSLTATKEAGSNTITRTDYITVTALAPIANFTANVTSGTQPLTVGFTDLSTGTPTAWNWSFGDGAFSIVQNPVHAYTNTGMFTVSLTAMNASGSNTLTRTNYITVTIPPPVANFTANVTEGLSPRTIKFTDTSTGSPTAWNWSFDDGALSVVQHPVHMYVQPGNHTVTLTASNAGGANLTVKDKYIIIYPKGDFNHNWEVDAGDAALVAYMVVGRAPVQIPDADFNSNGFVDIGDAGKIAYFVVGKIPEL